MPQRTSLTKGLVSTMLFTVMLACGDTPVQPVKESVSEAPDSRSLTANNLDRWIVVLRQPGANPTAMAATAATKHGGRVLHTYDKVFPGFAIQLPVNGAEALERNPMVARIERDTQGRLAGVPTQFSADWGLGRIDDRSNTGDNTFRYTSTGRFVHVYIIDTGIDGGHSEFAGRLLAGRSFVGASPTEDCSGHGTHVASLAAGSTYGVAKEAWVHPIRVEECDGWVWASDAIAGLDWVANNHVAPAVANMSLGWPLYYPASVNAAAEGLIGQGVTLVVSAGNGGFWPDVYGESGDGACTQRPANVEAALVVSATDANDQRPEWANFGSCVDLFAPGSAVKGARVGGGYAYYSGTSQAAPYATGVAATVLSVDRAASPLRVNNIVKDSATAGVVGNRGEGSPNRLLFSRFWHGSVSGYKGITQEGTYSYEVRVMGGDGTFAYQWEVRYQGDPAYGILPWTETLGTGPSQNVFVGVENGDFTMSVTVTSAGQSHTYSLPVFNHIETSSNCGDPDVITC